MTLHGLDRAAAPEAGKAKSMLDEIGGTWWNVYMGGPESGGSGWTPDRVRQYRDHGITHFLLLYVGRQSGEVPLLTTGQGEHDGNEACRMAGQFGHSAAGTPICLDLEGRTFDAAQHASLDYASGWCHAVRAHGFRPGVYSNPRALIPLHARDDKPDWVWAASWVQQVVDPGAEPRQAPGVPSNFWPHQGQRVWQYAGTFGGKTCSVGGLTVDINVADGACLAPHGDTSPTPGPHPHSHTYTVRPGDTLSGIAAELHIAGGSQALYKLNRDVIGADPNLIHPGQVLQLP